MRRAGAMGRPMFRALACPWALAALAGCSSEDGSNRPAVCMPGALLACDCPNGRTSTASCLPDGSGMGPCACVDPVGTGDAGDAAGSPPPPGDSSTPPPASDNDAGEAGSGTPGGPDGSTQGDADAATDPPLTSAGCGGANPPSGSLTLDVGGAARQYIVTLPSSYEPDRPHRLIFAWHGLGGRATQIASTYYGLAARAANSAIFIAAQGLPNPLQNNLAAWSNRGDTDIAFTRQLLEWAKTRYCVDVKRVFSIGMSNGGMMSNIVGCELGGSFRAIAAMSGSGPRGYAMAPCTGQVAVWISHGNRDTSVPFSYGTMSRDYWRDANNCQTAESPTPDGNCVEYQGCDPGFPVQFCEFDGGHMVPSFTAEAVWKFFEQF